MKRITALFVVIAFCGLMVPGKSDGRAISISPRVALPVGDFGDLVGTGFGGAVTMTKEVKGKPGRVGLVYLTFPEGDDNIFGFATSATAIGAFAGYKYVFGTSAFRLFGKLDTTAYVISQEPEATASGETITADDSEFKVKATPGIGVQTGSIAIEVDYDIAGDWMGINIYYSLGSD